MEVLGHSEIALTMNIQPRGARTSARGRATNAGDPWAIEANQLTEKVTVDVPATRADDR